MIMLTNAQVALLAAALSIPETALLDRADNLKLWLDEKDQTTRDKT